MPSRNTRAEYKLVDHVRTAYVDATHPRTVILQSFIGWAYANRHEVPQAYQEVEALALVFTTLLADHNVDRVPDFGRMLRARVYPQGWRARQWWRIYRTMRRLLPMQ